MVGGSLLGARNAMTYAPCEPPPALRNSAAWHWLRSRNGLGTRACFLWLPSRGWQHPYHTDALPPRGMGMLYTYGGPCLTLEEIAQYVPPVTSATPQ